MADATYDIMESWRNFYASSLRLKQLGNEQINKKIDVIENMIHSYRVDYEKIHDTAEKHQQAGEDIAKSTAQLEEILSRVTQRETEDMTNVQNQSTKAIQIGTLLGLIAGSALAFLLTRGIVRPVNSLTITMQRLAERDMSVEVSGTVRKDEIGMMARTVEVFKKDAQEVQRLQTERLAMDREARKARHEERKLLATEMRDSLGTVVTTVANAAAQLEQSAKVLFANSETTSHHAVSVTAAIRQALVNVDAISKTTDGLAVSTTEIGRCATESSSIAREAVDETVQTNGTMNNLSQSVQDISMVIDLIRSIADLTNLLALNATIEAARAGEAGKGFGVVAGEVNNLAKQTNKATTEIGGQIQEIQGEASAAETALQKVNAIIIRMQEISSQVVSRVDDQAASIQDIVVNLSQVADSTRKVSTEIDGFSQAASQTGQEATRVLGAAGGLTQDAQSLLKEIDAFIARICDDQSVS